MEGVVPVVSRGKQGRLVHSKSEIRSEELLTPALLCHKEPLRSILRLLLVLYGIRIGSHP